MTAKSVSKEEAVEFSNQKDGQANASLLGASTKGALILILLQVASRGLTFLFNQILLRFLSPESLGVSTQLELFSTTVLVLARETLRVVLQREPQYAAEQKKPRSSSQQLQAIINMSQVSIIAGIPLLLVVGWSYMSTVAKSALRIKYFKESFWLYGAGTVIELLAEPFFIVLQHKMLYAARARAESMASVARCIATCAIVWAGTRVGVELGALPFAVGYLSYAGVIAASYSWTYFSISTETGVSITGRKIDSRYDDIVV
jgi:oligosaccharide translocation protein RFT1